MRTEPFDFISDLLKQRSLVLSKEKGYLVESRWLVARKRGMAGLDDLVQAIRIGRDEPLLRDVTEAMTTNESFFFRDKRPFDQFREIVLPRLLERRSTTGVIRIWSAACSTGQEPYSIAMCLREEAKKVRHTRFEIIATDISTEVLEKSKAGMYSQFEVQRGLPVQMMLKYFSQVNELSLVSG